MGKNNCLMIKTVENSFQTVYFCEKLASNSLDGFQHWMIEDRSWWAKEIHLNMIPIINAFDHMRTNYRPGHVFRLFSVSGTSGNPSAPPLLHPLMIFSAVQSTVCLQLLLDANTSAASAFLCSLWRAELPAWHPVCLGWRWTLNWSKDSSLASLASFPPVRFTRQTSALENEGKLNIFFKKLLLTADLNLKSSLISGWSCILAVAGGLVLGIIKFELELFCSWGKKGKNHYKLLLAGYVSGDFIGCE